MASEYQRPYAEIEAEDQAVLKTAYLHTRQHSGLVRGEELRFATGADQGRLRHLQERQLLDEFSDQYRPTVLGLLYVEDAQGDLRLLDALIRLAHTRYRPGALKLGLDEITAAIPGLDVDALARLAQYASEVSLVLEGAGAPERKQFRLALHEQNRLVSSLDQAMAQRWSMLPARRSSEDFENAPPFRLFFRELQVQRFRGLRAFSLPLRPLTALVGPNGVGKSTVLDAVNFLAHAVHHGVEPALDQEGGLDRVRTRGVQGEVSIVASFELDYDDGDRTQGKIELAMDSVHGRIAVERELLAVQTQTSNPTVLVNGRRGRARVMLPGGQSEERYHSPSGLAIAELAAHGMHPLWRDLRAALTKVILVDRDPLVGPPTRIHFPDSGPRYRTRSSANMSELVAHVAKSEVLTQRLGELLREFVPAVVAVHRNFTTGGAPWLEVEERDVPGRLMLDELSAGTRQMMLLGAIYLHPEPPNVLLLEEPDAGVHVGALPALVDLLRSMIKRTNVVVTTHSPAFVGLLDPANEVFALERSGKGVRALSLDEALRSRDWLKGFGSKAEAFARAASERLP